MRFLTNKKKVGKNMKFNKINQEQVNKAKEMLEQAENKTDAIIEVTQMLMSSRYDELIKEVVTEANNATASAQSNQKLGLRVLNEEENKFYDTLKTDVKQAITAKQIDIIPNTIVDNTLADIKKKSDLLSLCTFAPADVKKWLIAEKAGTYKWGELTGKIEGELSATITTLNIELGKLTAFLIIPKAIRDLANPYVDKYFTAVLDDTMHDGLEYAFLLGTGINEPIGTFKQIASVNEDGTHKAKTKHATLKGFSPKQMAPVKTQLCHNGLRTIPGLALVCNPMDEFGYIDPALFAQTISGNYVMCSIDKIRKIPCANCPQGTAGFFIDVPDYYTMGISGVRVTEYDQTKALDDADVVIAKCYGNGRAVDDDVCYVFDPTKLEEFVPKFLSIDTSATPANK